MHVVSASRRTDIAAFYTPWLLRRLEAGYCRVPNPYSRAAYEVSLDPADVLALVLWTKNPRPLLPHLDGLRARGHGCYVQFTITPYDHVFEPQVLPTARALDTAIALSEILGPELVVWRYDPIVETTLTPWSWHLERYAAMAQRLEGHVRRCVFSFVQLYRHTRRRLDQLAVTHGFDYRFYGHQPEQAAYSRHGRAYAVDEMRERAAQLAALGREHGIRLETCCCDAVLDPASGVFKAHCIDAELVSAAAGRAIRLPAGATRDDCGCVASRDIGVYDTCPHGCGASYCYAVQQHQRAVARRAAHDPDGEFLYWPHATPPPPRAAAAPAAAVPERTPAPDVQLPLWPAEPG